ncbi:MAG TPA: HlyD family efflux transporter periplasmic adaptor subunit [Terriglobia bacterium]|jgi:HlyD family secretion protein
MSDQSRPGLPKKRKWLWVAVFLVTAGVATATVIFPRASEDKKPAAAPAAVAESPLGIGCRGWIEPEDGVLKIAVPPVANASIVASLQVREGDTVKAGQVLAVLDGRPALEGKLREAEADIKVARMKLAQIKAGPKAADIDTQKMEAARWQTEYDFANSEYQRYQRLRQTENATAADLDQKRIAVERAKRSLDTEQERLKALQEIRPEDVDLASAELDSAMAKAESAREQIERTVVRAPAAGTVIKIHAHPGEQAGIDGLLELAKTNRMYAIAEVYETDIGRLHLGQKATISGDLLPQKMDGVVTMIGKQIGRSELLPTDTVGFADTRVVRVHIELRDPKLVAGLIHGKVSVAIEP